MTDIKAAAKAIILSEANWCVGASARDSNGLPVAPMHPGAVQWDVEGALRKAWVESNDPDFSTLNAARAAIRANIPPTFKSEDASAYQDSVDHATMLAVLFA